VAIFKFTHHPDVGEYSLVMGRLPTPITAVFFKKPTPMSALKMLKNTDGKIPTEKCRKYRKIGKSWFFI
jgi:hypothetical protein